MGDIVCFAVNSVKVLNLVKVLKLVKVLNFVKVLALMVTANKSF